MIVWKKWVSKKFVVVDGKRYKVYYRGLFLFGFIPLYIASEQATLHEDFFSKK